MVVIEQVDQGDMPLAHRKTIIELLRVLPPLAGCRPARLLADGWSIPCAIGAGGVVTRKREGDHATPAGCWPLRMLYYRADRLARPATGLPARAIDRRDGWCDAPRNPYYNRAVTLPFPASAEMLWRDDGVYDLIVPLGVNDAPVCPARGSAVFLHIARADFSPTEGCVAISRRDLLALLPRLDRGTRLLVA